MVWGLGGGDDRMPVGLGRRVWFGAGGRSLVSTECRKGLMWKPSTGEKFAGGAGIDQLGISEAGPRGG